ncbi:MAG TPA: HEPN domain-containing protein, partial [Chloroflexota bacterium]|nr:HEPN domain-containing protein [Chloroflexota bacterium]
LAEKSLKAFLVWQSQPFRKTHNLVEIGQQCAVLDATLGALMQRGAVLSEYAWRHRYPGGQEDPDLNEAQEALVLAREVHHAILSRLPDGVRR